jgi:hypothetical protein
MKYNFYNLIYRKQKPAINDQKRTPSISKTNMSFFCFLFKYLKISNLYIGMFLAHEIQT